MTGMFERVEEIGWVFFLPTALCIVLAIVFWIAMVRE